MLLDKGHAAEEVSQKREQRHPHDAAHDVEEGETPEMHLAHARHERRNGADDGKETREEHGDAAVLVEEALRFGEVFLRQRLHLAAADDGLAHLAADPVVRGVAQNSRNAHEHNQGDDIQAAAVCREDARAKQQGVARQKRRDDQACLDKHDDEQRRVNPHRPKIHNPLRDKAARVAQKVDEELDYLHVRAPL